MKDDIYKHIVWVGCVICIAPLIVRGYMWGKGTDRWDWPREQGQVSVLLKRTGIADPRTPRQRQTDAPEKRREPGSSPKPAPQK